MNNIALNEADKRIIVAHKQDLMQNNAFPIFKDLSGCYSSNTIKSFLLSSVDSFEELVNSNWPEIPDFGFCPINIDISNAKLTNIKVPNSVTKIGNDAFYNVRSLITVKLSDNITSIGTEAFSNCINLTTINIPAKLGRIKKSAFCNCVALTGDIVIPDKTIAVGPYAFDKCNNINSVKLGSNIHEISKQAFCRCNNLTKIDLSACTKLKTIKEYAFSLGKYGESEQNLDVYLPDNLSVDVCNYYAFSFRKQITFYVHEGTLAEFLCKARGWNYKIY